MDSCGGEDKSNHPLFSKQEISACSNIRNLIHKSMWRTPEQMRISPVQYSMEYREPWAWTEYVCTGSIRWKSDGSRAIASKLVIPREQKSETRFTKWCDSSTPSIKATIRHTRQYSTPEREYNRQSIHRRASTASCLGSCCLQRSDRCRHGRVDVVYQSAGAK